MTILEEVARTANYTREFEIPSESRPNVFYTVKLWMESWQGFQKGMLSCSCPAWLYQRKEVVDRSCKHTKRVQGMLAREGSFAEIIEEARGSTFTVKQGVEKARLLSVIASLEL